MPTTASSPAGGARRSTPRWVVALGAVGVALGMLVGFRQRKLEAATRAFHERHGPPPAEGA